jgi:hypothetical protein
VSASISGLKLFNLSAASPGLKLSSPAALKALCAPCPAGSVSVAGFKCVMCPPGTRADAAKATCRACAPGYYAPSFGMTACKACPDGAFAPLPAAMACFKVRRHEGGGLSWQGRRKELARASLLQAPGFGKISPPVPSRKAINTAPSCETTHMAAVFVEAHAPILPRSAPLVRLHLLQCPMLFKGNGTAASSCEYTGFSS